MQRSLGIGYGRAARLIDFMAEDGIVGQYNGSQARDILITLAQWEEMTGQTPPPSPLAEPPKPRRTNKIFIAPQKDEDSSEEDEEQSAMPRSKKPARITLEPPFDEYEDESENEAADEDEEDADDDELEDENDEDNAEDEEYEEEPEEDADDNSMDEAQDDEADSYKNNAKSKPKPRNSNKRWKAESA